jgi:hypothetical protein
MFTKTLHLCAFQVAPRPYISLLRIPILILSSHEGLLKFCLGFYLRLKCLLRPIFN